MCLKSIDSLPRGSIVPITVTAANPNILIKNVIDTKALPNLLDRAIKAAAVVPPITFIANDYIIIYNYTCVF